MPKQAENGAVRPAPQLKRTTMRILIGLLVQNPDLAPLVPPLEGWTAQNARAWPVQNWSTLVCRSLV
jgi:hypothetical protein